MVTSSFLLDFNIIDVPVLIWISSLNSRLVFVVFKEFKIFLESVSFIVGSSKLELSNCKSSLSPVKTVSLILILIEPESNNTVMVVASTCNSVAISFIIASL